MEYEIIEKLAIAELFSHNAQYAGVARQAVADGYSSIDALFSVLLFDAGEKPERNHKKKLNLIKDKFPKIFATRREKSKYGWSCHSGIDWKEIEDYYCDWLKSRYETFDIPASKARARVITTVSANLFVTRWIADKHEKDWHEITNSVNFATYGYHESIISEDLCRAHDYLFSEANARGERFGNKLGTKMGSATNFCGADIIAGDDVTRQLIENDQEIASHAAEVYINFCRLMEKIRFQRAKTIRSKNPGMSSADVSNQATEFMLSMKVKYHGEKLTETGDAMARMLKELTADSASRNPDPQD